MESRPSYSILPILNAQDRVQNDNTTVVFYAELTLNSTWSIWIQVTLWISSKAYGFIMRWQQCETIRPNGEIRWLIESIKTFRLRFPPSNIFYIKFGYHKKTWFQSEVINNWIELYLKARSNHSSLWSKKK